jgi:hypothetical protein
LNVYGATPESGNGWYKKYVLGKHHRKDVSQKYFKLILVLRMGKP